MSDMPHYHENPYPDSRLSGLESRVNSIDQRVSVAEANWARLDERSARIAEDVGMIRQDVHSGLKTIEESVTGRLASVTRWGVVIGTLLLSTLVAIIVDLGQKL